MGRPPCCDKSNVKRGLWTAEEDAKILAHVSKHGTGNWTLVPKKAGLNRCGKSCRLRWTNYLRPDLNHDDFTPQEEDHIIRLHQAIGSRWSLIAKQLPGRTDNDVKNYWNTKLRKKLTNMGIDPITHKPISQLLSEFGNIGGLPWPATSSVSAEHYSSFSTLDFSSQFRATNQDIVHSHFFNEVTSSSCSSTSSISESFSCQQTPQQHLNWSEFLVREPYQSTDTLQQGQEEEILRGLSVLSSSASPVVSCQSEISVQKSANGSEFASLNAGDVGPGNDKIENSSKNSFVDTILDRDSELRSSFPEFLEGSFEYY